MSTGSILKDRLHLSNFSEVKIRRIVTPGSVNTYQVVFNSRTTQLKLTTYMLNTKKLTPHIVSGNGKSYFATPWYDIDKFNGQLSPAIFFVTDLAGFYGDPDKYSEKVYKSEKNKLNEITIPDLERVDTYTSNKTMTYRQLRQKYQGQGIKNTKLIDSKIIPETGSIQFLFLTESTEITGLKGKEQHVSGNEPKQQYSLSSNELEPNKSKTYEMTMQLDNVFPNPQKMSWLEVYDGETIDRRMIKELLEVADVKLWDNTPAFQYQGFRYRLTRIGASIYPETIPDSQWGKIHGAKAYLDKHWSQLFQRGTIGIFLNQMLSILTKYCKQLGYAELQKGKVNYSINVNKGESNA